MDGLRDTFKYLISRQICNLSLSLSHVATGDSGTRVSGHGFDKGGNRRQRVVKWAEVWGVGLGSAEAGTVPSQLPSMLTEGWVPCFPAVSPFDTPNIPMALPCDSVHSEGGSCPQEKSHVRRQPDFDPSTSLLGALGVFLLRTLWGTWCPGK